MTKITNGEIYRLTNRINSKSYIGLTTRTGEIRRDDHITESQPDKPRTAIARAIKKYGVDNFDFDILYTGITDWKTLNDLEIATIAEYGAYRNGYNYHRGGQGEFRRHEAWEHAKEIADMYEVEGMTTKKIGEHFGANGNTIRSILASLGISCRTNKKEEVWEHAEQIADMYVAQRLSALKIAKHFNVSSGTILHILDALDIPRRTNRKEEVWEQAEKIADMYIQQRMSTRKIAKVYGCFWSVIVGILKSRGIPIRPTGWHLKGKSSPKRHAAWKYAEEIGTLYQQEFMVITEIADLYGCSLCVIVNILKSLDIPRRTLSQSQYLRRKRERLKYQPTFNFD